MKRGATSPEWDGVASTAEEIARVLDAPNRITITWAGMHGWELRYRQGIAYELLPLGDRLAVVDDDALMPVTACYGDQHVTPHRGCILR
jgi:hypothetical protein